MVRVMKPFKYGCVVGADFFCPRPQLQKRLTEYVKDGQNVVLVGERRMGKKESFGSRAMRFISQPNNPPAATITVLSLDNAIGA